MIPKITEEMRKALQSREPGRLVAVEDERAQQTYWLVSADDMPRLWQEYIRTQIDVGVDEIDAGEIVAWDPEKIKRQGRERLGL